MGSILIGILIDVAALTFVGLIGYAIGKQRAALDRMDLRSRVSTLERYMTRKNERINFLQAECDHWQARVRKLEGFIVRPAMLTAKPGQIIKGQPVPDATLEALGLEVPKKEVRDAVSGLPVSDFYNRINSKDIDP